MTKKRQPGSSIVNVLDDENLDLNDINEDGSMNGEADGVNYMNMDISTDNIEDIVTEKIDRKMNIDDIYMMNSHEEGNQNDVEVPKGIAVDDPVRLYLREIGRIKLLSASQEKISSGEPSFGSKYC